MKKNSKAWGPPYGGRGRSLFDRPLVPIGITFAAGILTASQVSLSASLLLTACLGFILASVAWLVVAPFRFKAYGLLPVFFSAGALMVQATTSCSVLAPLAEENKQAVIEGIVLEPVKVVDNRIERFSLRGQTLRLPDQDIPLDEHVSVSVYRNIPDLQPGDRIRFRASLRPLRNFNNPGNYDYKLAMQLKGLTCAAHISDGANIERLGPGRLPFFRGLVESLQRPVRDFLAQRLTPSDEAMFRALVLGERQGITPALREPFNRTGLGHILAVSGLHIGLVAGIAFFSLKWMMLRSYRLALTVDVRKVAALLTCLPVIGYALLAGFQVSTQRAMIMVLAYLASIVAGRERDVWSTLSLAGLIILIVDPKALFSISFQLSFMAVIGILWLSPAILNRLHRPADPFDDRKPARHRVLDYFIGLAVVSAAAAVFLLPVTAAYFHRIPLASLPANVSALPILGMWVIPAGLLSSATLPFSTAIADGLLRIGVWGLTAMMAITEFWSDLPWASVWTVTPNLFEILLFYVIVACAFFLRRFGWACVGLGLAVLLALGDAAYWIYETRFHRDLRVTFLDVGKGNAAFVSFPGGKKMLIDGGGFGGDGFDVGEMVVAPFLWHEKVLRVDYLVLSHPQADHMNGLRFIARHFRPREFWHNGDQVDTPTYGELLDILDSKGVRKRLPSDLKEGVEINGVKVEVLHPDPERPIPGSPDEAKRLNNNSLVLRISYGNTSFLFPGDLEKAGEEALIAQPGRAVQSDILLMPHHGSRTSSSREFLKAVNPRLCIVSSGERTPRNFPHPSVLKRVQEMGCTVFRTSLSGAVTVTVGHDRLKVQTFLRQSEPAGRGVSAIHPNPGPRRIAGSSMFSRSSNTRSEVLLRTDESPAHWTMEFRRQPFTTSLRINAARTL